jgi:hypothetical protein
LRTAVHDLQVLLSQDLLEDLIQTSPEKFVFSHLYDLVQSKLEKPKTTAGTANTTPNALPDDEPVTAEKVAFNVSSQASSFDRGHSTETIRLGFNTAALAKYGKTRTSLLWMKLKSQRLKEKYATQFPRQTSIHPLDDPAIDIVLKHSKDSHVMALNGLDGMA